MSNTKLKIAFDIGLLSNNYNKNENKTGIHRVNHEILQELTKRENIKLFFYTSQNNYCNCSEYIKYNNYSSNYFLKESSNLEFYNFFLQNKNKFRENLEKQQNGYVRILNYFAHYSYKLCLFFLKKTLFEGGDSYYKNLNNCDVVFSGLYAFPEKFKKNVKSKKLFTVYDLIPIKHPEFFGLKNAKEHWLYKPLNELSVDTKVFCISEHTRKDFLEFRTDFKPENVFAAPLAASDIFYKCENTDKFKEIQAKYKLPDAGKYILSVCTLEPRKNLKRLIEAFAKFTEKNPKSDIKLVLAGNKGWLFEDIFESELVSILKDKIIFTGFVEDEDLASLYSNCKFFAYISLYEGFGLPILEAMQCGCAIISSNTSSMPEVGGDSVLYVEPKNVAEISNAISELDNNANLRTELGSKALNNAKNFSWKNTVDRILNFLG